MQTFYVNPILLCRHSQFFDAAFNKGWKEAKERSIDLPEDHAETFELWANYINAIDLFAAEQFWHCDETDCDSLPDNTEFDEEDPEEEDDWSSHNEQCQKINKNLTRLLRCYHLGDKLGDFDFCDKMIDCLIQFCRDTNYWPASGQDVFQIFKRTTESSPLRRLIVDMLVYDNGETFADRKFPEETWSDVGKRLMRLQKFPGWSQAPYLGNTCVYHHHIRRNAPCYKSNQSATCV